jgi:hypothetical protein
MAFFQIPNPWNPGYALPDYVLAEPPGRGTFTTAMIPRRTVDVLPPDYLAQPEIAEGGDGVEARTSVTGSGTSLSGHTLDKPTLAGSTLSKPTLSGSTLGRKGKSTRYQLRPNAVGADLPGGATLPVLAAAAAAIWLLARKRR